METAAAIAAPTEFEALSSPMAPGWGPKPPAWMRQLCSDDVDEVTQVMRTAYEHSRVVHRGGPLGFRAAWAESEDVVLGWFEAGLPQTLRGALDYAVIHLQPPQGTLYRVGRSVYTVTQGASVAVLPPTWDFTRYIPSGKTLSVGLGWPLLEAEFTARLGPRAAGWRFGLQVIHLQPMVLATLTRAMETVVSALAPGVAPSRLVHARSQLVSQVVDCLMPGLALAPQRDVSRSRLDHLEAWIDAHVSAPISLGTLCEMAGVGERSLQKAFEARRGVSPMRFVVERRLEAARRRLEQEAAPVSVTQVAMELGFDHLGRFASDYRTLFGESPSVTLGRGRGRWRSDFGLPA